MRKLALAILFTLPLTVSASALPASAQSPILRDQVLSSDVIEVKGGRGGGHGWGRAGGHRAFGWSRGRKVGWRGHGCPPGHWKKGWC